MVYNRSNDIIVMTRTIHIEHYYAQLAEIPAAGNLAAQMHAARGLVRPD
jgi:hypothetical protein